VLIGVMRTLAVSLGENAIGVSSVSPGLTDTPESRIEHADVDAVVRKKAICLDGSLIVLGFPASGTYFGPLEHNLSFRPRRFVKYRADPSHSDSPQCRKVCAITELRVL